MSARPSPARSAYKQQGLVLAEVKAFDRASLRHVDATRVTDLGGVVRMEANARLQVRWSGGAQGPGPVACAPCYLGVHYLAPGLRVCPASSLDGPGTTLIMRLYILEAEEITLRRPSPDQAEPGGDAEAAALRALAALRLRAKKDNLPARVAGGLFIGGAGAARNLKALRKRGITHIVNAAPAVPCHFRDNPEGAFEYLALPLFDDPDAGGCWVAGVGRRTGTVLMRGWGVGCRGPLCLVSAFLPPLQACAPRPPPRPPPIPLLTRRPVAAH